jgi:hypothetical protein
LFSAHAREHRVRRWDVPTRRPVPEIDGLSGSVRLLAYTPDGDRLLTFSVGDDFRSWDPATGKAAAVGTDNPGLMTALMASSGRTDPLFCQDAIAGMICLMLGWLTRLEQVPGLPGCSAYGTRSLCAE